MTRHAILLCLPCALALLLLAGCEPQLGGTSRSDIFWVDDDDVDWSGNGQDDPWEDEDDDCDDWDEDEDWYDDEDDWYDDCDYSCNDGDWRSQLAEETATFSLIGVSPERVSPGDEVTIFTASDDGAPTDLFFADDFLICTFDGCTPWLEIYAHDFEPEVDPEVVVLYEELEVTPQELVGVTVSAITFRVPGGTQTGDAMFFPPYPVGAWPCFDLVIE